MEVQKPEYQKSNSDQVVLDIDQPITNHLISSHTSRRRLKFIKPRSRFEEINYPVPPETNLELEEELQLSDPQENTSSTDDEDWYDDEEGNVGGQTLGKYRKKRKRKISKMIEWILFIIIIACFVCSLTLNSLKHKQPWGFETWKWCLVVMVVLCGHLISGLVVGFLVFLIERNFTLREKVLYFVYGLRKSFQNCVWLGLVLIAWMIVFPDALKRIGFHKKVFRFLIAVLSGATIWLLKIVFVKVLTSSFHVATFFDRLKETVFNHYILDTLSGSPYENEGDLPRRRLLDPKSLPARLRGRSYESPSSKRYETRRIDMERLRKLRKMSMEGRATAWSVKRLVSYVMSSGLSTISSTVDDFRKAEKEITSEWEARKCARRIFKNVAKPGAKYIEEEDLLKFLKKEEVHTILPLFEGAIDSGRIAKSSFRNWVVHAYIERKALAHSLNDTKTAIQQLHKLASAIVIIIITVVTLLVMGLATTKVLLLVTSQLLLVGFMFQNMCKTIFESIIFVFVMHPFDVGDRCVVDNVQMLVEEMNILTTVFLRYDNEKIYYPNSVLLTKPISNFRRSPDMADSVDFTIDVFTPVEDVTALKKAIQVYIESKPKYWSPKHCVIVKDIANMDKMMMGLCVQHTMNHQNFGEKRNRRSELVFELKKIFENLGIKYHLLPREVHVTQFNATDIGRISIPP